jgi:DNA-binding MarR family transcriptional regulator
MPRLRRAIRDLGIIPTRQGSELLLDAAQYAALLKRLGFAPQLDGLTREEMFVLAALNLHPLGLRSMRAVARAASVSPTTASRAVTHLRSMGILVMSTERVVEGEARDVSVTRIASLSPAWIDIAPAVRQVVLPERCERTAPAKAVPQRLWHHFWNAEPSKLRLPSDADYIAARLLRSDDPQALSWAASHLDEASISKVAQLRGVDDRRRSLILHLAHG